MARPSRRQFLKQLSAVASATVFAGCGGGEDAGASTPTAPTVGTSVPPVPPPLTPPPTGAMQFFLSSPVSGTQPFAIGFAFKRGDIPAGQVPVTSVPSSQVTVLTRWPDGSAKWGVVAGRVGLTAGEAATVKLSASASVVGGSALTTADLAATGISATIGAGSFGTASWGGPDWGSPFRTWVSGPEMSSWIYRKPIGSDPHLVAWLEVRLFASGEVEVLPWIENGYLRVAGPTNKAATYTFTLGGTQRFSAAIDLPNRCRTPLVSGTLLSHWLGTDPSLDVRHDTAYLQSTELVPSYYADTPSDAAVVTDLPSTFTPLQQGSYPSVMGTAGYHGSIGLLPEWDVLYLTCPESSAPWTALQRNAYSAGRYGIHYRDETTNKPIRFSDHPNLVLGGGSGTAAASSSVNVYTAVGTGTAPAQYSSTHAPAMGYLAALVTGRAYHVETVQFQTTVNYLRNGDAQRQEEKGIFRTIDGINTTRGAAWAWRTLAMASSVTPESGDNLYPELIASMTANIDYYYALYVAQANNPQGFAAPYTDYGTTGVLLVAPWQQDFFTASVGLSRALGLPLGSTTTAKLAEFFDWKAKSIVGRFGGTGTDEFLYRDAASYNIAIAPSDTPDFATGRGPWYANWGEVYAATYTTSPGDRVEGDLRGAYFPSSTAYWGNLQPALAYAVRFGVPDANIAYARMTGASNWGEFLASCNETPVWSVRPAAST